MLIESLKMYFSCRFALLNMQLNSNDKYLDESQILAEDKALHETVIDIFGRENGWKVESKGQELSKKLSFIELSTALESWKCGINTELWKYKASSEQALNLHYEDKKT